MSQHRLCQVTQRVELIWSFRPKKNYTVSNFGVISPFCFYLPSSYWLFSPFALAASPVGVGGGTAGEKVVPILYTTVVDHLGFGLCASLV
jgi:hypothetical protein